MSTQPRDPFSSQGYSLAQRYPELSISQLPRTIVPFLILLLLECIMGFALPSIVDPVVPVYIALCAFAFAFIQGRYYQYNYYEENIDKKGIYRLYFLNVAVFLLQGFLLMGPSLALHAGTVEDFPKKEAFIRDMASIRVAHTDFKYLMLQKIYLRRPDKRRAMFHYFGAEMQEGRRHNRFVRSDLPGGFKGDEGCLHKIDLASFANVMAIDTASTSQAFDSSVTKHSLTQLVDTFSGQGAWAREPVDLSHYDTGSYNIRALKIISDLDSSLYLTLQDGLPAMEHRYRVEAKYAIDESGNLSRDESKSKQIFTNLSDHIPHILDNRSFGGLYWPEFSFVIFALLLIYAPLCAMLTLLTRRIRLRTSIVSFPLWPFSLLCHFIILAVIVSGTFELLGRNVKLTAAIVIVFILLLIIYLILPKKGRAGKLAIVVLQTLHYHTFILIFVVGYQAVEMLHISSDSEESVLGGVIIFCFFLIHAVSIPFLRLYHKAQYLPRE